MSPVRPPTYQRAFSSHEVPGQTIRRGEAVVDDVRLVDDQSSIGLECVEQVFRRGALLLGIELVPNVAGQRDVAGRYGIGSERGDRELHALPNLTGDRCVVIVRLEPR